MDRWMVKKKKRKWIGASKVVAMVVISLPWQQNDNTHGCHSFEFSSQQLVLLLLAYSFYSLNPQTQF